MATGNHYFVGYNIPPTVPRATAGGLVTILSIQSGSAGFYLEQLDFGHNRDLNDSQASVPVTMVVGTNSNFPSNAQVLQPVIPGTATSQSLYIGGDWGATGNEPNISWLVPAGQQTSVKFEEDRQPFVTSGHVLNLIIPNNPLGGPGGYAVPNQVTGTETASGGWVASYVLVNAWICEPTS
jgi:hypothetical protein